MILTLFILAMRSQKPSKLFEGAADVAIVLAFFDGFAFVVEFFAATEAEGDFHFAAFEIEFEGDEGEALLFEFADQFVDFLFFEEEFSGAAGVVVEVGGAGIVGGDVDVEEPGFTVAHQAVAVADVDATGADGFHFRADEGDAGFVGFEDFVEKPGFAVVGNDFDAFGLGFCHAVFIGATLTRLGVSPLL